jgi:hypothetical protein
MDDAERAKKYAEYHQKELPFAYLLIGFIIGFCAGGLLFFQMP